MIKKKFWHYLPDPVSRNLGEYFLKFYGLTHDYQSLSWRSFCFKNLEFANRLGIAGGMDKNALHIQTWWSLGAGFVEVGTITPKAQKQNEGKVVEKSFEDLTLWNHLGFPNDGVLKILKRMQKIERPYFTPLFANIGKNRNTPLEEASSDYVYCIKVLQNFVDAFVINISSPNTAQLKSLLEPENLKKFLRPIKDAQNPQFEKPLFLKLSPDMSEEHFLHALKVSRDLDFSGWILTNSSQNLKLFENFGGVSGKPLAPLSKKFLKKACEYLKEDKKKYLLISAGGVLYPSDVEERLSLGADLVQSYSAFVLQGLEFFKMVYNHFKLKE